MEHPLLAGLEEREHRQVLARMRSRAFERGEIVVAEGEPADSLHLVVRGRLAVQVATSEGAQATINLLGRGDFFGELALLDDAPGRRSATVTALEASTTLALSATDFRALRARHRAADRLLLTLLGNRVRDLSAQLLEASTADLDARVAARLARMAELYAVGAPPGTPIVVPLTQQQFADLVGGTRQSVNQILQGWVAAGAIVLKRGRIEILSPRSFS